MIVSFLEPYNESKQKSVVILNLAEVMRGQIVHLISPGEVSSDFDIRAAANNPSHGSIGDAGAGNRNTEYGDARNRRRNREPIRANQSVAEYSKTALPIGSPRAASKQHALVGQSDAGEVCPCTAPSGVPLSTEPSAQIDGGRRIESDPVSVAGKSPTGRGNDKRGRSEYLNARHIQDLWIPRQLDVAICAFGRSGSGVFGAEAFQRHSLGRCKRSPEEQRNR